MSKKAFLCTMLFAFALFLTACASYDQTPIQLTIESIPQKVEPRDFLRGLGYDSFAEHEFLRRGPEWIALRTNTAIQDLRIIYLIPRYEAVFDGEWHIQRHYTHDRTRLTIDLLPEEPLVMAWQGGNYGSAEFGLEGLAFTDTDGHERYFMLRKNDDVTYLREFENLPHNLDDPLITIVRPCPEIKLVVAWIMDWRYQDDRDAHTAKSNFLQQFDAYTEFDGSHRFSPIDGWWAFSANIDLYDFQFFRVGHSDNPWVDDERRYPFYVGTILDSQAVVPFGEPVVIPWHPGGSVPNFGIGFLDESGQQRNFAFIENNGGGFPPMFVLEFIDRGY